MNNMNPTLVLGDTLFGTWIYVDEDGKPVAISNDLNLSSSVSINNKTYSLNLTILDQIMNPGEIAFTAQSIDWEVGLAEMDIKVISGEIIKHSEKYCFRVIKGITS